MLFFGWLATSVFSKSDYRVLFHSLYCRRYQYHESYREWEAGNHVVPIGDRPGWGTWFRCLLGCQPPRCIRGSRRASWVPGVGVRTAAVALLLQVEKEDSGSELYSEEDEQLFVLLLHGILRPRELENIWGWRYKLPPCTTFVWVFCHFLCFKTSRINQGRRSSNQGRSLYNRSCDVR